MSSMTSNNCCNGNKGRLTVFGFVTIMSETPLPMGQRTEQNKKGATMILIAKVLELTHPVWCHLPLITHLLLFSLYSFWSILSVWVVEFVLVSTRIESFYLSLIDCMHSRETVLTCIRLAGRGYEILDNSLVLHLQGHPAYRNYLLLHRPYFRPLL